MLEIFLNKRLKPSERQKMNKTFTSSDRWNGNAITAGYGGTGVTTLTGMVRGNGTNPVTRATAGVDYISPTGTETLTNATFSAGDVWNGNTMTVGYGGTGTTTLTGMIKGNGTNPLLQATAGVDYISPTGTETLTNKTISSTQISGNISGKSANVTGTIAVGSGGTGVTTLTGMVRGNGTNAATRATAGVDYISPTGTETLTNKTIAGTQKIGRAHV